MLKGEVDGGEALKCNDDDQYCYKSSESESKINLYKAAEQNRVFLFYDANPQEGFNLRRDVYMRVAIMANYLNNK